MVDREILEAQKELLAHTFSQAQAYTNVILVAGYAGFFAIWSFLKPDMTKATVFWSGLLISLSLAGFIAWEVYNMFFRSRSILGIARAVKYPEQFEQLMLNHTKAEQERLITYGRIWLMQLPFVVVTGFGAIAILISAFIHGLWVTLSGP